MEQMKTADISAPYTWYNNVKILVPAVKTGKMRDWGYSLKAAQVLEAS